MIRKEGKDIGVAGGGGGERVWNPREKRDWSPFSDVTKSGNLRLREKRKKF